MEESVLSGVARCAMQQCMLRERSDRGRFLPIDKKASSCRGAYRVPLLNSSVCVCQCVTFVVFTEIESCTRPTSTKPASMEAGEYGLTRGTWGFRAPSRGGRSRRAALDSVVCFGVGRIFSGLSISLHFQIPRPRAVSLESLKRPRKPGNRPTENSSQPIPARCTV